MRKILSALTAFVLAAGISINAAAFSDITGNEIYADAVSFLNDAGIMSGYYEGDFKPSNYITRAEMSTILYRVLNIETGGGMFTFFDDVPTEHWACEYISAMAILGIVNGDGNGNFRPESVIKYEEAAKMIICAAGVQDYVESTSDWADGYIKAAEELGISDGEWYRYAKGVVMQRSDVAMMLYNWLCPMDYDTPDYDDDDWYDDDWDTDYDGDWYDDEYDDWYDDYDEPEADEIDIDAWREEVTALVNEERAKAGISPLVLDLKLNKTAQRHSEDMVENNFFNHTNLSGQSPFDRMAEDGISYMAAGENIAYGQRTPEEVMNSWMNSEGHRNNILNGAYNKIGIGIAVTEYGTIYWTQNFIGN